VLGGFEAGYGDIWVGRMRGGCGGDLEGVPPFQGLEGSRG
jgi:hypothetical protein